MNLSEFKAWFDGYTENMKDEPSAKQWKRIKERVAEIEGSVTTYPVFIDRWKYLYPNYYPSYLHGAVGGIGANATGDVHLGSYVNLNATSPGNFSTQQTFNPTEAFHALGKAESLN